MLKHYFNLWFGFVIHDLDNSNWTFMLKHVHAFKNIGTAFVGNTYLPIFEETKAMLVHRIPDMLDCPKIV